MKIRIPNVDDKECYIEDKQSIVLLGANGAGKTRMSVWIDENNPELNIHRISAQKSLNMPEYVSPTELKKAEDKFLYGTTNDNRDWLKRYGKKSSRWGNEPEIHMLDDYRPLMELLMTENFEKSIEYREKHKDGDQEFDNETKLEKIKKIWEKVITHRKLKICAGKIEVESIEGISETYNGNLMSDGERAIFHFIAEVVSAEENSLIIIDEPENHLHNSILERLWNEIESARQDCVYLYITHNLDFARTRNNTQIVWIKNMIDKQKWDYALLDSNEFSDDLLLEILGNRQGVLFVEGTQDKSIDRKLYSRLFPKYSIMPLEGCASVIQATKAYNKLPMLHYKTIIERFNEVFVSQEDFRNTELIEANFIHIKKLKLLLRQTFLKNVGEMQSIPMYSTVLTRRDGYRQIYSLFLGLKSIPEVDNDSENIRELLENKSLDVLYENYCYFGMSEMIAGIYGQRLDKKNIVFKNQVSPRLLKRKQILIILSLNAQMNCQR